MTVVTKLKGKYERALWTLKCNKICAADVFSSYTAKNRRNNLVRRKQTTNMVTLNIFRGFRVIKKVGLMFQGQKTA